MVLKQKKYSLGIWSLQILSEDHVGDDYLKWVRDPEVNEFLFLKNFEHSIESLKNYVRISNLSNDRIIFGIYAEDKSYIGNFSLYDINVFNGTFDFGYFIGEKKFWGTDAGISACLIGLSIAFEELKLRKTFTYVEKSNLKSRFVLQKIGFVKEAILKDRVVNYGKLVDSVVYSLDISQWNNSVKLKFQI
ncbi:MAG: GNAT family N-acetyltransferase [Bacteroidota bacterium]|jgi:RimJ/RimL family protein N-acetyltransferase